MSSYDLNQSLPIHQVDDDDADANAGNVKGANDEKFDQFASLSNHNRNTGVANNYSSFEIGDQAADTNKDNINDDDNVSILSKVIDRGKLISEVLERTYGRTSGYVKFAGAGGTGGENTKYANQDDDTRSVFMMEEFEKGHRVKFGTWDGVCARCLLNIFGVIMYIRVGYIVGESGVIDAIAIIMIATAVTLITTLSMSALCTNGVILGGGAYYFISRAMGPSVGGSIGLVFSVGNMFAVSLYIIGFAETMGAQIEDVTGWRIFDEINDIRIWSNVLLVLTLILAVVGMSIVIKTQLFLLLLIMISLVLFFIGSVYKTEHDVLFGIDGWFNGNFESNLEPQYDKGQEFWGIFAIFFPAVTGIMAGANISGDLKNPQVNIPKGTLWSIAFSTIVYVLLSVVVGAVAARDELKTNNLVMADICSVSYFIYAGIYAATLSSAIEALVGAPRILQAVTLDLAEDCFPFLMTFSIENKAGDPIRGYLLTCLVTFLCNLTGELNVIAELISQFFMLAYFMLNFAVFYVEIYGPNKQWNPSFKYYNKWLSFIGAICSLASMFVMNLIYAIAAIIITGLLYAWIEYQNPRTPYIPLKRFYFFKELKNLFYYIFCCCLCKCCHRSRVYGTTNEGNNNDYELTAHNS